MFTTKNLIVLIGRQAAVALTAIAVATLASFLLAREISRVSTAVIQNRHLATTLEKRTEVFGTIARDARVVGTNDTLIERAFIPSDNIFEFISILESIALKNTATESFHFENPVPSSESAPFPLSTIGYQNTLSLNVFTFMNYLKDFERLPYFTKIENLNISSQDGTGWRGTSSVSFHATLYAKSAQ